MLNIPDNTDTRLEVKSWEARIKALGLTPPEFAVKADVPYRSLRNYLNGKSEPLASTYVKIVELLRDLERVAPAHV